MNDTNLIALMLELVKSGHQPVITDHTAIWIAALAPIFGAFVLYIQSRSTAATVEKVHVAVNSGAAALAEKAKTDRDLWDKQLADMNTELQRLSNELAASKEREHASEVAKALVAIPVTVTPAPLTTQQLAQIKEAISPPAQQKGETKL